MRCEREMFDLIVTTAQQDERIRAVIMNGSRANPNAPRDIFQDFDIVYLVTEVAPFKNNLDWIRRFGELLILQMPEEMGDPPGKGDGSAVYLMQFMDGNRLDLSCYPIVRLRDLGRDSLSVLLAVRVQAAVRRGYRFLVTGANPMSQPILARNGFKLLTHLYAYEWAGKSDR